MSPFPLEGECRSLRAWVAVVAVRGVLRHRHGPSPVLVPAAGRGGHTASASGFLLPQNESMNVSSICTDFFSFYFFVHSWYWNDTAGLTAGDISL